MYGYLFYMVDESDEFKVTELWKGLSEGVCVKVVEVYSYDGDEFVVFKNDSSNMETEVIKFEVENAIESGVLDELDSPEKIQI